MTRYLVEQSVGDVVIWKPAAISAATVTSCTVTSLLEGLSYRFRVAAENAAGIGKFSLRSELIRTLCRPGKPGKPTAKNVSGATIELVWAAPTDDGGDNQLNYRVEYQEGDSISEKFIEASQVQKCTARLRLKLNKTYVFRVAAVNATGQGSFSDISSPVKTSPGICLLDRKLYVFLLFLP